MSNYQKIKVLVNQTLNNLPKPLASDAISNAVNFVKEGLGNPATKQFLINMHSLDESPEQELQKAEWERLGKELELHFDVALDPGVIVTGNDQKDRDITWWTRKVKPTIDTYYWSRYKEYIDNKLPFEVVKTIDDDTDVIMNNIAEPSETSFSRYGMVVGHVQSGKTGNYAALLCKAADAGYKFIVVIAGGMNNLRNQTQDRINEAFVGKVGAEYVGVGTYGGFEPKKQPVTLTTPTKDFNKNDADKLSNGLNFDSIKNPIVIVIKKNTNSLKNVIKWITDQYKNGISEHAMLVIDDESDYASINTKEEEDPTIINEQIRKLLNIFGKSAYVAYTATPYANIFIDYKAEKEYLGLDLFPKDFIYALDAPSNYFGAQKIFLDPKKKHLVPVEDYIEIIPLNHKKTHRLDVLPHSLEEAMRLFIMNIAIRNLRGQEKDHNSMLVHITRFTDVHKDIAIHVTKYLDMFKKSLISFSYSSSSMNANEHMVNFYDTFTKRYKNLEFTWEQVIQRAADLVESVKVFDIHTQTKVPLVYDKEVQTNAIVVGGTSLSRGYTLEGLSVSYFLRTTIFYDTLMQMGRWFGYRTNYEDLCKLYMTEDMFYNFKTIIEATLDLVESLKEMAQLDMTPLDFGLAVQHHPDSGLQVTARNKLKNAKEIVYEMNLSGHLKETSWLPKTKSTNTVNIQVIENLIHNLLKVKEPEVINSTYLWRDIDKQAVESFLEQFIVYELRTDEFGMRSRMPIKFVKEYVKEVKENWDIALYGGDSKKKHVINNLELKLQKRAIDEKGDYFEVRNRQVSTGTAEEITLTDDQRKKLKNSADEKKIAKVTKKNNPDTEIDEAVIDFSRRKAARKDLKRPLLMLHILEGTIYVKDKEKKDSPETLPAFSISFPRGIESGNKNIALKVNNVYLDKLIEGEDSDD
ncbi:Z1 domain-containing protein [Solibacillus sp. NPDC093137]|uniref:Z1 domain-containing protein n=1 Tax=Solibacillus sp. NPDC093137 TaxID=3390678 RepID=UPI003CFE69B0